MTALGPIIKAYRESQGLSQIQFAEQLGVDQATLSRLERRTSMAPLDPQSVATVESVAVHMNVPPDRFVEYRLWRVQEIGKRHPELVDEVYDLLVAHAAVEDERQSSRERRRA